MKRGIKNNSIVKKEGKIIPILLITFSAVVGLSVISIPIYRKISYNIQNKPSISKLQKQWEQKDYQGVFDTSSILIEKNPINNTVLTYRGYSAFFLGVAETAPETAQTYMNESIRSLRIALMNAKEKTVPQIKYMLGKAYFHKNIICSYHYYADLVIKYLEESLDEGYQADDIPELLGLSYGQLGMPYESIRRFSDALLIRESDFLLFNIAKEYYAQGNPTAAKQYLFTVSEKTNDDRLLIKAQNLLAKIYLDEEKYEDARELFNQILSKDDNSAEAHYGLGVIYEKNGDLVKARAEWRKCLRLDNSYEDALNKLYR